MPPRWKDSGVAATAIDLSGRYDSDPTPPDG